MPHLPGARTFAVACARKSLRQLAAASDRALKARGADEIHDLRVAIRRFVQILLVFKECFPAKPARRSRRALKKMMAVAGRVRDLDIALALLGKSRLGAAAAFRAEFQGRRNEAERTLVDRLEPWTKRRVCAAWRRKMFAAPPHASEPGKETIEEIARQRTLRYLSRVCAYGDGAAAEGGRLAQLHRLRIAGKKLRYTLELFTFEHEASNPGRLRRLKRIQELLGEVHDVEVVRNMIIGDGGKTLAAELERWRAQRVERFRAYWEKEFAAGAWERWRKELSASPGETGVPRKPPGRTGAAAELARRPSAGV